MRLTHILKHLVPISSILVLTLAITSCNFFDPASVKPQQEVLQAIDTTIYKALSHFSKEQLNISYSDVIMLTFLIRDHFGLEFPFPSINEFYQKYPELREQYFKIYGKYFDSKDTFNFPRKDVEFYLQNNFTENIDARTAWSMYCSSYPLPKDFLQVMRAKIKESMNSESVYRDFVVTHSALQIKNMEYANCWKNTAELNAIKTEVKELLIKLIEEDKTTTFNQDLRFEAIAMLYYMGYDELVKPEYIKMVLNSQFTEGGWGNSTTDNVGFSFHTTIIAIWVLLEYKETISN